MFDADEMNQQAVDFYLQQRRHQAAMIAGADSYLRRRRRQRAAVAVTYGYRFMRAMFMSIMILVGLMVIALFGAVTMFM